MLKKRFYLSLKGEHFEHVELLTRDHAERENSAHIEMFYNRGLIHTVLGKMSLLEFEEKAHPTQNALRGGA